MERPRDQPPRTKRQPRRRNISANCDRHWRRYAFVESTVEPGAMVVTDAWSGYSHLPALGYDHLPVSQADDPAGKEGGEIA